MVCNSEPIELDGQEDLASDVPHDERRQALRHRTLKTAKMLPMNEWSAVNGVVRDQSNTGARIACERPENVPDEFRLVVVKEATIQPCTVRWRNKAQLGVSYEGEPKPAPPRKF
jgi:PilZ domain